MVIAGLGLATAGAMLNPGPYEPRACVQDFANDFLGQGPRGIPAGRDFADAEGRFIYVLNIGGPRADAYFGLAQVALERHQPDKALRLLKMCLDLDPTARRGGRIEQMLERKP